MSNSSSNQSNSATRGGMGSIPTPANSGGSGIFGKTAIGATHGNEGAGAVSSTTGNGARRSSQETGERFGNLSNLKRSSLEGQTRRASLGEQGSKPGIIGQMWNNFTKGGGDK